jgi:hypothetical protein
MLSSIIFTLIGVVLGALPSWYFSRMYYLKSGTDLDAALQPLAGDQRKLLQATNTVGRMLEQAGLGKPTYDEAGNMIGIAIVAAVRFEATSDMRVTAEVRKYQPPQQEQPGPETEESRDA